ncbi:MAG: TetR/AcrR family transcriptional regulator [Hyphomonadaceae bacterium]|jgi:TetR/AcrR family transcriptional regulator|uniref:TetR/AcrR family transcriptional regulator n=1 Tax=Aquidulcibacter sp. TaxID=2052990 RepID=UPI0022BF9D35|nr:TetR/AcrR family transcriptional regulator [Aquidulcibacter sp.]MCE2889920.1 TetR/AcrR family transcriptional regulator [Hyphomonadaceae bacterium]MCZ8209163.1 TetR/AcrR family transcriptional regulator [Aquidulcibacter sp.]
MEQIVAKGSSSALIVASAHSKKEPSGGSRDDILKAALRCFSLQGFDGTSIADIARAAKAGHPLVHYHFKSKDDLWRSAVDFAFKDLVIAYRAVSAATTSLDPIQALKIMVRSFVQFCGQCPQHVGLMMMESTAQSDRFDWLVENYLAPLHKDVDALLERAKADGLIRDIPLVNLSSMFVGSAVHFVHSSALIKKLYGVDTRQSQEIGVHADWLIDVLFQGILKPT